MNSKSSSELIRNLPCTQQDWHLSDDGASRIYNTPVETGALLDVRQGKDPNYPGTCGIVSCVNVLRLAGRLDTTEGEALNCAIAAGLCRDHGGTNSKDRQALLLQFGLESDRMEATIKNIADCVEAGRGVIISVHAAILWHRGISGSHAVTVTSVQRSMDGRIEGFYICDSGSGRDDRARFYRADHLEEAFTNDLMNVTTAIIR